VSPASVRTPFRKYVLDANALIGFFEDRSGTVSKVRRLFEEAFRHDRPLLLSAVNWGEVFYITCRHHGEEKARDVEAKLQQLPVIIIGVDAERATRVASLKCRHGLGYADAFAAELAIEKEAWLVTADPEFSRLGKILSIVSLPQYRG